jgi:hypothetical protein
MKKFALLGSIAVLIAGTTMAASHPAFLVHKQARIFITAAPPGSKTLHDQNRDDAGTAVLSEGFDGSQAADDFVVPKGHTWMIKEVDVTGVYLGGTGPADSENVSFYSDNGGLPGDLIVACANQNGTDNGTGSFAIQLSKTCKVKLKGSAAPQSRKKSGGTTYWVSVQANIDFFGGAGEWGWELSTDTSGNPAAYRDSGSCATWCSLPSDLMFALRGKDKG